MKINNRKSVFFELKDFCTFSMGVNSKRGDYVEVTEWTNGEGYDIEIDTKTHTHIQLTIGQFEAIKKCIKILNKGL